jgi:hypothetical protein
VFVLYTSAHPTRSGAPEAEARFDAAMAQAKMEDKNAQKFPTLYVSPHFHLVCEETKSFCNRHSMALR